MSFVSFSQHGPLVGFLGGILEDSGHRIFARELGRMSAECSGFRICTSGYRGRIEASESKQLIPSFAYEVVRGAAGVLDERQKLERIQTSYSKLTPNSPRQFIIGTAREARGRNATARGLSIIRDCDLVCLAGGAEGTKQYFEFARAIDRRVLPLPFLGHAARKLWDRNHEELGKEYGASILDLNTWDSADIAKVDFETLRHMARASVEALQRCVQIRCLVFMPFASHYDWVLERIIFAAANTVAVDIIRIDLEGKSGDIIAEFRNELEQADCAIAVVTNQSPNVLYEIGYAHAASLPVILLHQQSRRERPEANLPFYLRSHRTVWYSDQSEKPDTDTAAAELARLLAKIRFETR